MQTTPAPSTISTMMMHPSSNNNMDYNCCNTNHQLNNIGGSNSNISASSGYMSYSGNSYSTGSYLTGPSSMAVNQQQYQQQHQQEQEDPPPESAFVCNFYDQYDNIASHTNKGIELLDKYGQFTKELSAIETDYACKLRRLVKNFYIKKKDEEDNMYTVIRSFNRKLSELGDIAGQHETIAEEYCLNIVKEIACLLKELKEERKRYLHEGTRLQNGLHSAIASLDKSKRVYEKTFRESEKAHENFLKADADLNLSRAEVEKARQISMSKSQMCDDAKLDYANHLQKTNDLQRRHYGELMPKVFRQLQDMEERRASCIRNYIQQSAHIRRRVLPIIDKCIDGMIDASEMIEPKEDSRLVIEKYKSGVYPPQDFPFDDLSIPRANGDNNGGDSNSNGDSSDGQNNCVTHNNSITSKLHHSNSVARSDTIRGTLSAARFRKRGGLFGIFGSNKGSNDDNNNKDDFSDLPPNQRRKRIQNKIDLILGNIQQETAVREGLTKMKHAYEQNKNLGDPQTINGQLTENQNKLEKLQVELKKYQTMLSEVLNQYGNSNGTTPTTGKPHSNSVSSTGSSQTSASNLNNGNGNGNGANRSHRNSISDSADSLSRSESENSVANGMHNGHQHNGVGTNPSIPPPPPMPSTNGGGPATSQLFNSCSNVSLGDSRTTTLTTTPGRITNTNPGSAITTPTNGPTTLGGVGGISNLKNNLEAVLAGRMNNNKIENENDSSNSHESGISTSHLSINDAEFADAEEELDGTIPNAKSLTEPNNNHNNNNSDIDDDFDLVVLGTAKALYPFEGQDEGSIRMTEGEDFEVIELDQGDGWTRVRRMVAIGDDAEEGFVPTAWIEIALNNDDAKSGAT